MIFDNNIAYQTYRVLIAIFGTLGMIVATSRIKENKMKNLLIVCGYAVYAIAFSFLCIRFFGFLFYLRGAIFTISIPGVVITYLIADTTLSKHIFCCLSQLLVSLHLIISLTLLNTWLGGSTMTNVLLLLPAYLAMILLEYFSLRNAFLHFADTVSGSWRVLSPIPCSFSCLIWRSCSSRRIIRRMRPVSSCLSYQVPSCSSSTMLSSNTCGCSIGTGWRSRTVPF